jgi:hypothetical protein
MYDIFMVAPTPSRCCDWEFEILVQLKDMIVKILLSD